MNSKQKLVQQQFLNNEEEVIKRVKGAYWQSQREVTEKIKNLTLEIKGLEKVWADFEGTDEEKAILQSRIQSKIYQKQYQEAIKGQINDTLNKLHQNAFLTVSDYLTKCYDEAFLGTMFDLHGQGIPLIMPIDQESVVRAVQLDSKISHDLYTLCGENVANLKKTITAEVSRGIISGSSYEQVAQQIKMRMVGTNYHKAGGALHRALTIARTEGHRVQVQAGMDACIKAKEMGADVVKQWDATLDDATRESHVAVDGEIRELDKPFSNGLMFPSDPAGGAAEVINCRCALLQRARWALDEDELKVLEERAAFFGIDKTANFEDFKQQYLKATEPPKKEYLTKKKLEQKISDADDELAKLNDEFIKESGGWTYDEVIDDFGTLEGFADPDTLDKLKAIKGKMDAISMEKANFEDLLDKKLVKAQLKKLKKEQILLQDQLDAMDLGKTYSNIWKDDVTLLDYPAKQGSINAKKAYFEQKLKAATDPDEITKWKSLLDDLDDFQKKGAEYLKVKTQFDTTAKNLTKLQKSGTMKAGKIDDAFSQDRKDAALWFDRSHGGFRAADQYFDPPSKAIHGAATRQEQNGFYTYTSSSGGHNRPLAGFQKPYANAYDSGWEEKYYVGAKNVWIDYEGKGDQIRDLTTLCQKSTYADDVWLQSGQGFQTIEGFLGIPYGSLSSMSDAELQQFVGCKNRIYNFISTAVNEGGGSMFNEKPLKINFYAPSGSQMLYASDCGAFGKGENEMILQRGGSYEITRIYWGTDATDGNRRKIFVDMDIHVEDGYDLFQQDPNEWTGSRKNYMN